MFAVGANERYVVVKQHPHGNKSVTQYFIVDVRAWSPSRDSKAAVLGPLSDKAFEQQAAILDLPPFSKTLDSLQ